MEESFSLNRTLNLSQKLSLKNVHTSTEDWIQSDIGQFIYIMQLNT